MSSGASQLSSPEAGSGGVRSGWKTWAALAALVVLLLALKAPPGAGMALRTRTFALNAFMFALAAPSIWWVVRLAFGAFVGAWMGTLFSLLALLPMWVFLGDKSQNITLIADPTVRGWFSVRWVLLACVAVSWWLARRFAPKADNAAKSPRRRLLTAGLILLALLAVPQLVLRFGTYSPTGLEAMDKNDEAIRPGSDGYFKLAYPTNDVQQHINPGGLFVGNEFDQGLSKGYAVHNDRPTIGYLYSTLGYFAHPYVAARALLFCFYLLTAACAYRLALAGGAGQRLSLAFGVLVLSCEYLVTNANSLNVYIHVFGTQPILLYTFYRSGFCRRETTWAELAGYVLPLCLLSVGYYPFVFCLFNVFAMLAFYGLARREAGGGWHFLTRRFALQALCVLAAPVVVKAAWIGLLDHYGMLGDPNNRDIAVYYAAHIRDMLLFAREHTADFVRLFNASAYKLVRNYLELEYWPLLGVLGLLGLFSLPRLVRPAISVTLYAMLAAFFCLSLAMGLVVELYPHPVWPENMPLTAARANGGYAALVLGQVAAALALFSCAGLLAGVQPRQALRRLARRCVLGFSLVAYAVSFLPVAQAWLVHHGVYPLFPGGLKALGW